MFGIEFTSLPPSVQVVAAGAVGLWVAYQIIRGLTGPKPSDQTTRNAQQLAMELADSELRNDLQDAIRLAKDGLQQQILQLAASLRAELKESASHSSEQRQAIYERLNAMDRERNSMAVKLATIEARLPRPRS